MPIAIYFLISLFPHFLSKVFLSLSPLPIRKYFFSIFFPFFSFVQHASPNISLSFSAFLFHLSPSHILCLSFPLQGGKTSKLTYILDSENTTCSSFSPVRLISYPSCLVKYISDVSFYTLINFFPLLLFPPLSSSLIFPLFLYPLIPPSLYRHLSCGNSL